MKKQKLSREYSKYIERELYDYEDTLMLISQIREDIIYDSSIDYSQSKLSNSYKVSNPTEDKVIQLITNKQLNRAVNTIKAIDSGIKKFNNKEYEFYKLTYMDNKSKTSAMIEMFIEESTYYYIKKKVIEKIAIEMGLL